MQPIGLASGTGNSLSKPADKVTSVTNELGYATSFAWDALDRQTSVTDPLGNAVSMAYNAGGLLTSKTDALGNTTDFEYNSRNWLTKVKLPDPDGAGSLTRTEVSYG